MIRTGLDLLLDDPRALAGRSWALLSHSAALSADLQLAHRAFVAAGAPPRSLLSPEHGFYGVEQDMVPSVDEKDPLTGVPIVSLYGENSDSLEPDPEVFSDLDLLVIDLQDVGARYYTYAATAVWAAKVALDRGCEVWVLDRPNPLGGEVVEGNLRRPGFESFVGAFEIPARHGLTLGELVRLEARRQDWPDGVKVWAMEGWRRAMTWKDLDRAWCAPSPNIPTPETALVFPGCCLVEATQLSEGRGTTRPFQLIGAPGVDPAALASELSGVGLDGVRFVPTYFRPQYQKHRQEVCGGVWIAVTDPATFRPYRCGVGLVVAARRVAPEAAAWRSEPYEFVSDRPAIDLLTGDDTLRRLLESDGDLEDWIGTWSQDEESFRTERREILLYPEES